MRRTMTFVAALLLAAGCVTSGKYEKKSKEAADAASRADAAAAQAAACEQKADALQKELAAASTARDELQVKAAKLAEAKGAAEAKSAQYEQLAGQLQKQIQAGQIEVSELRGRMTVKLKDKVLFPSGSAKLSKEGGAALDVVAGVFKEMQGKNVIVAGYTDDVPVAAGQYKDNWELSSARAIAVVRYLAAKGVPPAMLGAAGFSQFRPIVPNDTPGNRSQNRRIEIALTAAEEPPVVEKPK
ncbi:MAG TPA: OmpA family protein [Anaeromyxobacter sp.]|nr:OmpA family protein [Anaeromyxobacter sp.]